MIKFIGIAISVLFCSLLLKDKNRTFSIILSIAGGCLLFAIVSSEFSNIIKSITDISSSVASTAPYIKLMLKVLGITLITQFVSDICRDNGESALASMTEAAAKIIVVSIILPLFETVIAIVSGLVK
ncbi:MAG: SpoIIIAC/SpoIIIAD family protein [Eubacterium sp.]